MLVTFFFFLLSYVGNVEINVEVKRYFCKAGVKGIQVHVLVELKALWSQVTVQHEILNTKTPV